MDELDPFQSNPVRQLSCGDFRHLLEECDGLNPKRHRTSSATYDLKTARSLAFVGSSSE